MSRCALFARLAEAECVAVISAPAGSGKTVLIRSWIAEAGLARRAAWVPVDREEHDPRRFWISVADALRGTAAGHPDPERFATHFSGTDRTVVEYLLAEVLDRQSEEVRRLLLRTSVLERVSGPLADVLTGSSGGERILQDLEQAGAFVVSLDAHRSWFRGALEDARRHLAMATSALAAVPADRRGRVQVMLAVLRLFLARRFVDFPVVVEEAQRLLALTEAADAPRLGLSEDLRAAAFISLGIAESNGILLPFLLDPAPALLERHRQYRTAHPTLISKILDLLRRPTWSAPPPGSQAGWARSRGLDEQLTDSETRILRYLPTHLTTHEIANELFLSENTVSTHRRHLYAKLGVHSRHEAVDRARALGLLAPSTRRDLPRRPG